MDITSKKSITIDGSALLGGGGVNGNKMKKPKRDKTQRKIRPSSIVQPSALKKTLLERIKQHQRTRERSTTDTEATDTISGSNVSGKSESKNTPTIQEKMSSNFSQSMDFLKKLTMKRKQQHITSRTRRNESGFTSSEISNSDAKTPEAKILNKVAETLTNGEIITNTGVIGLPIQYKTMSEIADTAAATAAAAASAFTSAAPLVNIQAAMPGGIPNMPWPSMNMAASVAPQPETIPNLSDLAEIYNNTVAASTPTLNLTGDANADANANADAHANGSINADTSASLSDQVIHVPENPESFLPSIFIKEEPPHGCLKNGKKPTFREWADKMLKKPIDTIKSMFGGGDGDAGGGGVGVGGGVGGEPGSSSSKSSIDTKQPLPENVTGMRVKIRKTKKKKFRIGKHDDVVGVLLKNKEAQRHIQKQHLTLKQKTIGEIKKHLYEKNLLKIGSNAPPDVLRRMYEDSILTGDVKNTGRGVLLHNFLSEG